MAKGLRIVACRMKVKASIEERWLPVPGRLGYEVSNHGRVRWRTRGRKLTPDSKGYLRVSFWENGKAIKVSVHKMVAAVFNGSCPVGCIVRHRDGNNANCAASNLLYGTQVENEADKAAHGTKVVGAAHPSSKLIETQVREIRRRYVPRDPVNGLAALGREFGIDKKSVEAIVKRETWKHIQP